MTVAIAKIPFKKWVKSVIGLIVLCIAIIVLVNYIIDPYGILRRDFTMQFQEPNMNFVKTKYLLNGTSFDSLLMGSSRVNFIDVSKISQGRYYNYWYSEGLPTEHLANVKILLDRGMKIKNIMVGLDDFSYLVDFTTHVSNLLRQPHPLATGKSFITFYSEYFFRLNKLFSNVKKYLTYNIIKHKGNTEGIREFDIYESGRMIVPAWEDRIIKDPLTHVKDNRFLKPTHYEGDNLEKALSDLYKLKRLADNYGIHLIFFINPIHRTTYLDTDLRQFFIFKRRLAEITSYYDFSGLNSITTNNVYYYETSHYRPIVGDMMLKRIFGHPQVGVPRDFGVFVTRNNIEMHLLSLCRQLKKIDIPLNAQNTIFRDNCLHDCSKYAK